MLYFEIVFILLFQVSQVQVFFPSDRIHLSVIANEQVGRCRDHKVDDYKHIS